MPYLELIDETLDINSTENYDLSVEISPDNLSFCILDSIRNKFILLRSYKTENDKRFQPEAMAEIVIKDEFLTKKYRKANIITPSFKYTLVPSPLFETEKKDEYYLLNHSLQENQTLMVDRIKEPDSYLIYSQLKSINELISRFWPGQQVYHHLKPWFAYSAGIIVDHNEYLFIHLEKEFFTLAVYNYGKLKLCNSFVYKNSTDILYYTLNIVKSHGMKPDLITVFSGHITRKDNLISEIASYLRNIRYAEPKGNYVFSYVMNEIDLFRFINIISAVTCV
jgi:hypothetical protein